MTPTEAYLAGLATLPALVFLIALARPTKLRGGYQPTTGAGPTTPPMGGSGVLPPKPATFAFDVELDGIDKAVADLARVTKAATEAGDRLREVHDLSARINH